MKKIFNAIVSFVCCLMIFSSPITTILPVMAEGDGTTYINKEDVTERNIKVISNVAGDTSMILYEYQSVFYITMDTVKELTGLSTSVSTGNGIFSAAVTDGIRTVYVNLEDRTISDEINDKVVKDTSGEEIVNDINAMLYNNEFLVEAVPFLRYLGASVEYINGYFICLMNQNSIWSVLPDAVEDIDKFLIPFTSYIPDYEKRLTLDIIGDYISGGNLIISAENTMNNYYKEAIYDMFEVNPYSYDSVKNQEERNIQNEKPFFDSKQLLDLGDQLKDVGIDTAKILEDLYLTSEIDWLDFKWNGAYKLGFTEEASKISKELNMKTVKLYEDTVDGGNIDKAGYVVSALIYGAKIYSDYNKINNYDNDTAYCLAAEVDSMKYAYSDTSSIGWLQIADRVSKDVLDSRNNARDSILDNTIDLMQGEGNDLIVSAASGEALLVMKAATFLTNIICKDIIEAEHHEIITMLQQDMQYQSYNLCYELWKKAESENFSNAETVIRFVDALKFYYRFSMAYDNSIQQWGEHYYPNEDWRTPFQNRNDAMALKFYNLLNAKMMPNENLFNYEALEDDEFSESVFQESASETINYEEIYYSYIENELIPKYGLTKVDSEIKYNELNGITSAYIIKNEKETPYLLIVRLEFNEYFITPVLMLFTQENEQVKLLHEERSIDYCNKINIKYSDNMIYISAEEMTKNFGMNGWSSWELSYEIKDNKINMVSNDTGQSNAPPVPVYDETAIDLMDLSIAEWTPLVDTDKFKITDFTNLRDHIKTPTTQTSTDISGRYSNDNLFVDVTGKIGSEGKIRVEYVDSVRIRSIVNYQGKLSEQMSFDADDRFGTNSYNIVFRNGEIEITIHGKECYNKLEGWLIPDIHQTLKLTTKQVPNYDISSWTKEMIIKAINNYLKQSSDWKQCAVFTSDIYDNIVTIRYQGGSTPNILTNYFVAWGGADDIACIAMENSGIFKDFFHLTEYLNAEVSPTNKVGKIITEKDPLNVRQSPSTESEKIGTVDKGSTITILSEVNGWYEIEFNGKSGYVSGEFVQIVE